MKEKIRSGAFDAILSAKERRTVLDFSLDEFQCEACQISKDRMRSLPNKSYTRPRRPGQIVVSDFSGPFGELGSYILLYDLRHSTSCTQLLRACT